VIQRGHIKSRDYRFSMEKETKIIKREQNFFVHHRRVSLFKRVEFISDKMSYIALRDRSCNIYFMYILYILKSSRLLS
jgi:hypothetical protein